MTGSEPGAIPSGYGIYLLQTLLALGGICLLAYVFLKLGAKRLHGFGRSGQAMKVVEHLAINPRHSLYLVEVDGRRLLVGAGEGGLRLLKELEDGPGEAPENHGVDEETAPTTTTEDQSSDH